MTTARPRALLVLDALFVALLVPAIRTTADGVDPASLAAVRNRAPGLRADATGAVRAVVTAEIS